MDIFQDGNIGTVDAGLLVVEYYGSSIEELENKRPNLFSLIFQNPVRDELCFKYFLAEEGNIAVKIYDKTGRLCYEVLENKLWMAQQENCSK